jgi:hypothetical protein
MCDRISIPRVIAKSIAPTLIFVIVTLVVFWIRSYTRRGDSIQIDSCSIYSKSGAIYVSTYGSGKEREWSIFILKSHVERSTLVVMHIYSVPYWFLAIGMGFMAIAAVRYRRPKLLVGHCRECGYDLRASFGRCPECGSENRGDVAKNAGVSERVKVTAGVKGRE